MLNKVFNFPAVIREWYTIQFWPVEPCRVPGKKRTFLRQIKMRLSVYWPLGIDK